MAKGRNLALPLIERSIREVLIRYDEPWRRILVLNFDRLSLVDGGLTRTTSSPTRQNLPPIVRHETSPRLLAARISISSRFHSSRQMNEQQQHYEDKLRYEIDSWDLAETANTDSRLVIIDTRSESAYSAEHIPGSLHLPHREMTSESTSTIDRNALVVTYCDGIGCNASTKGALNMSRLGFTVKELIGGLDWWKRDGHPTHLHPDAQSDCGCG